MKPFTINRHGRLVFPSNFSAALDLSLVAGLDQLHEVVTRDFDAKAPSDEEIRRRVDSERYRTRYELLRDVVTNLAWASRYSMTMYETRVTRWRDVPRARDDVFLPVRRPWPEGAQTLAAVQRAWAALDPTWDPTAEQRLFDILLDLVRRRRHCATQLGAIEPTVAELLRRPEALTYRVRDHDPDHLTYGLHQIVDCAEEVPELESLHRVAMQVSNEYPWAAATVELAALGEVGGDDFVALLVPRDVAALEFVRRVRRREAPARDPIAPARREPERPTTALRPMIVPRRDGLAPRFESLAAARGEQVCTNEDVVRNAAHHWSPMTAESIRSKTGIEQRVYTARDLEELAFDAARAALEGAGREPAEIGAVVVCSCTMTRLIPSMSTRLSGRLGIYQTGGSYDIVAACAGFPYGIAQAVHCLQTTRRPVLVVWAEKFSDKIGAVRTSRMLLGDAACAAVIAPGNGPVSDVEVVQTLAGGPMSEIDSIIWPNPQFDDDMTIYGPDVRTLARRYLEQTIQEVDSLAHPDGATGSLMDAVDLVVPHQANRPMVTELAREAGLDPDRLYFNIEQVGNTSSASIPMAIYDAVREGVIDRPMRLLCPGFGAGAVGGYAVVCVDPSIVVAQDAQVGERSLPVPALVS